MDAARARTTPSALVAMAALLALGVGCQAGEITQYIGVGQSYATRCSADMTVKGETFEARCTPPSCDPQYDSVSENHVVVAVLPGERVVGYAERICLLPVGQVAQEPKDDGSGEPAPPL